MSIAPTAETPFSGVVSTSADATIGRSPIAPVVGSFARSGGFQLSEDIRRSKLMIVDDEEINVLTVRQHLRKVGFGDFVTTSESAEAIGLMRRHHPDLVLLDVHMPGLSGLEVLSQMSQDSELKQLPVIVLTADTDPETQTKALQLGAYDFLPKPVEANHLGPRVRNALLVKLHFRQMETEAERLEELVRQRTSELYASRQQLILSLARAAENRDNDTGNHVIRVGMYAGIIGRALGFTKERAEMLAQAAQLHDVGKIGIPDSILFKPGQLEPDQYEIMQRHCSLGRQIIEPLTEREWRVMRSHTRLGESILHVRNSPMLMLAARIAQTHHERWDGSGYPLGLAGEDIPIEGRITSVADVFDAVASKRPYKPAFPRLKCFEILEEGRGLQFDPKVLDAFFSRSEEIVQVQMDLMDNE